MNIDTLDLWFAFDLTVISIICAVAMFIGLKARQWLLIALFPVLILCAIDSYSTVNSMMGASRKHPLPAGEVEIISAVETKEWVHFWYVDREIAQPRAIKIPPSEQAKQAAKQAAERGKKGQRTYGKFKEGSEGSRAGNKGKSNIAGQSNTNEPSIEVYDFSTEFHSKKHETP